MAVWRLPWFLLGLFSLGCGLLGVVLPLVPTTPFLLLSAYGFSRSSPRFHRWLTRHPRLGPPIRDWHAEGAISRRAKALAMAAILATPAISLALGAPPTVLAIQLVVLSCVTLFILTRPSPAQHAAPNVSPARHAAPLPPPSTGG
jgi:uncharacterized protein